MYSAKEIKENLAATGAIKGITSIYQEIASFRMRELRGRVVATGEFLAGVSSIYNHAKQAFIAAAQREILAGKRKDLSSLAFIRRNGKKVFCFLAANEHLYGTLIIDIWRSLLNDLRIDKADVAVVGRFGRYLAKNENLGSRVFDFNLDDDQPAEVDIKEITAFLSKYEKIVVYHGKMVSVLSQAPIKSEISGGATVEQKIETTRSYLFEPSPGAILEFFESEIIAALFHQAVLEHQLARFAARMVAMDTATQNADEQLAKLERELRTLQRRVLNKKQLEIFAGFTLWGAQRPPGRSGHLSKVGRI